jgi:hypothetical protein
MINNSELLRIEKPCPFVPTSLNKCGANFYCKSCSKHIVDFRGKTMDEIKLEVNNNTCGIFTNDLLPGQQSIRGYQQILFYLLALL